MKRLRLLHKIMLGTHMYQMLGSFLAFFFVVALLIMGIDPSVNSYGDSLWYCFAACTTIGFGDVVVTTAGAKILTVILSIYAIIVIAFIPGVLVSYFTEYSRLRANKSMVAFLDKLERVDKLSPEELQQLARQVREQRSKHAIEHDAAQAQPQEEKNPPEHPSQT